MKNVLNDSAQTGACAKKVRHVGQSKVMESHFDLVNPYHADFEVGGVHNNNNNNNTRISAPGRLRNLDFPPPSFLLVYETQTCGRLGKKNVLFRWRSIRKGLASGAPYPTPKVGI